MLCLLILRLLVGFVLRDQGHARRGDRKYLLGLCRAGLLVLRPQAQELYVLFERTPSSTRYRASHGTRAQLSLVRVVFQRSTGPWAFLARASTIHRLGHIVIGTR